VSGAADAPLAIPSLNRDGDLLSDLVLPLFGSIAGAESVLLGLDEKDRTTVVMAEAPHGTAPALLGKNIANPMAMILAAGAVLHHAGEAGHGDAVRVAAAIYASVFDAAASGIRTPDLGGHAGTSEVTDAVIDRIRTSLAAEALSGG
jgi:3-isopropylmalate dehydrogenase